MNRVFLVVWLFGGSMACEPSVLGSGIKHTQYFSVPPFTKVVAGGEWKVIIQEGGTQQVRVATDDNLMEYLDLTVEGDELRIGSKKRINPRQGLEITIRVPKLDKLFLLGKSKGQVSFKGSGGTVEVAGKAYLTVNGDRGDLTVVARGAARVTALGAVDTLTIKSTGASWIDAAKLVARTVHIIGADATRATVRVMALLKLELSGVASADYLGNPQVELGQSDPARVHKMTRSLD